jgi:hypothetical protein
MKKYMIALVMVIATITSVNAQYDNRDYAYNDDRYYYDNDFDWHWDIRVQISNGIQRGLITQHESNRLYRKLEDVERKEYVYQADGIFSGWEQQEVWDDVIYLNQCLGIELNDFDRNFYGFDVYGYDRRGYNRWFYQGGYDFFRFDKRGFGSIRLGYTPRPNYYGWYNHRDNHIARKYYSERSRHHDNYGRGNDRNRYDNRRNQYPSQSGRNRDSRSNYDDNRRGDDYGRNSQGNNGRTRNDRIEIPDNRSDNNRFPSNGGRPERIEPNNRSDNGGGYSQGRRNDTPQRVEPPTRSDNGGSRSDAPQRVEPPTRSDNGGGRSDAPQRVEPPTRSDNGGGRSDVPRGGDNGNAGGRGPR